MTIQPASDRSLLVSFGDEISIDAHRQVARLTHALEGQRGVLNLHPAFASVLIDFDPRFHSHADIEALVHERMETVRDESRPARVVEIPVCYGGEFGPDLEFVARHAGLAPERVVELHAAADYLVYFVGFATCFPYLGGLPPEEFLVGVDPLFAGVRAKLAGRYATSDQIAGELAPAWAARDRKSVV